MPKHYRKRFIAPRDKYSVEQTVFEMQPAAGTTTTVQIVPPTTLQGMRKVKHLTINASVTNTVTTNDAFLWALFYLPAGMQAPGFSTTTGGPLVEPNQYVMNCGVFDSNAGPLRVSSRVARNLNSGDSIILLVRPLTTSATSQNYFSGICRYAVTLQ